MGCECAQKLGSQGRGDRDVPSRSLLVAPQIYLFPSPDDALDSSQAGGGRRDHSVRRVTRFTTGFSQQHGQAGITIAKDGVDAAFRGASTPSFAIVIPAWPCCCENPVVKRVTRLTL